jgi:very-short-patch-repair endonuclease
MGVGFRRQHPLGPYIVDFCAPRKKIIIELDGEGHKFQPEYDAARTMFLKAKGYKILRFWNDEVIQNIIGVMKSIQETIVLVTDK